METVGSLREARAKVDADIRAAINTLRRIAAQPIASVDDGIQILSELRREVYEDINQIQHEYLIILAIEWLVKNKFADMQEAWLWNPRQKGGREEPDLLALSGGVPTIAAEVTASQRPVGVIDSRMAKTLSKLGQMEARKFYFVRTEEMLRRAQAKIRKSGYSIEAVLLSTANLTGTNAQT